MPIPLTPLDSWIAERIGARNSGQSGPVSLSAVQDYQLDKMRETLDYVKSCSPFHRARLEKMQPADILDYGDLEALPFMSHEDLRTHAQSMLCVQQDDIARIVTMQSSGTTGKPKRLFFSEQDLEKTIDFFHNGIQAMLEPGQRMLILLPGATPDSTGDLLARGLVRMGGAGVIYGLVKDPRHALQAAHEAGADSMVGFPVQILGMARLDARNAPEQRLNPKTLLLCSDYISHSIVAYLEKVWGCAVFSHWGTVETGLGGGVECCARQGCHLRQADLLLEIVDPQKLRQLPHGSWGEIVLTTLSRQAMPIIRYRTGDLGRLLSDTCSCGSSLLRLDKVQGRMADSRKLANGRRLRLPLLDEIIFSHDQIMDYQARIQSGSDGERLILELGVLDLTDDTLTKNIRSELEAMPEMQDTDTGRGPRIGFIVETWALRPYTAAKRILIDERQQ